MTDKPPFSRAMVVTAHPDDADFSCSGTVARWCAENWEVVYVICTDGSKGTSDMSLTGEQLAEIRKNEQIEAGKVLGLKDVVFLGYPDAYLEPTLQLRKDIAREIRRHKPDILVCLYPNRNLDGGWGFGHPDHLASGEAAMAAVFPTARDHLTFPDLLEAGLEPHKVSEVWIVGHPNPDVFNDVTDHMETALQALLKHTSQLEDRPEPELRAFMYDWRRKHGNGRGLQYAEAFKRITFERPSVAVGNDQEKAKAAPARVDSIGE